jgi:hypothetical protein
MQEIPVTPLAFQLASEVSVICLELCLQSDFNLYYLENNL